MVDEALSVEEKVAGALSRLLNLLNERQHPSLIPVHGTKREWRSRTAIGARPGGIHARMLHQSHGDE